MTVTATDSAGQSDTVEVLILVGNEDEPPLKPGTPVVTQSPINSADLVVTWTAPDNEGRPPITDYLITYSLAIGGLGAATVRTSELTATLTNLERLTRYQIGVRADKCRRTGGELERRLRHHRVGRPLRDPNSAGSISIVSGDADRKRVFTDLFGNRQGGLRLRFFGLCRRVVCTSIHIVFDGL